MSNDSDITLSTIEHDELAAVTGAGLREQLHYWRDTACDAIRDPRDFFQQRIFQFRGVITGA